MARFRLRHQSSNIELPQGQFVIGRGSACNLSVEDASMSRRHAMVRVDEGGVVIVEDLGSRNGVRVNGVRIEQPTRLAHLDRISMGNQELLFTDADQGRKQRHAATSRMIQCDVCGAVNAEQAERCESCGNALSDGRSAFEGQTIELRLGLPGDDVHKSVQAFAVIAGIADKALALNSLDKAEQMLGTHLDMMLLRYQRGETYPGEHFERAVGFALRLGEGRNGRRWLHWMFVLFTSAERLMDAGTIDRLHELVRRSRYADGRPLRAYLDALVHLEGRLSAGERFLVKRLEALYRVIAA